MAADHLRHGAAHAQRHHIPHRVRVEIGAHVHRVADAFHRLPEEELLGHLVQLLRHLLEAAVAGALAAAGGEGIHGPRHRGDIADQVDVGLVLEEAAPLRLKPDQRQVLRLVPPGLRVDAAQHARHRQDGRTHVEAEGTRPIGGLQVKHRRLAAEPGVLVQHGHLMAARRRGCRRRQPAEPGTHHHHMRGHGLILPAGAPAPGIFGRSLRRGKCDPSSSPARPRP